MPTYNAAAVSDAVIAFRKPITLQQGRALRDNPLAIAEGSAGAPKVGGAALNVYLGRFALTGTAFVTFTDLGRVNLLRVDNVIRSNAGERAIFQVGFSTDNGATWGSTQNLYDVIATAENAFAVSNVNLVSGVTSSLGMALNDGVSAVTMINENPTLTVPANVNAVRFRSAQSSTTGAVSVWIMGGRG